MERDSPTTQTQYLLDSRAIFAQLRDVLSELYSLESDSRVIVADAGLDAGSIAFSSRAKTNWHNILAKALQQNRLPILLEIARNDFLNNQSLTSACAAYHHLLDKGGQLEPLAQLPIRGDVITARKWSVFLALTFTLFLISGIGWFLISPYFQNRTVYFLLDISDQNSLDLLRESSLKARLNITSVPKRVNVGLAVFGGNLSGKEGCNDVKELVKLSPRDSSIPQANEQLALLSEIRPQGFAGLQAASEFAIQQLSNHPGINQIVIITAGIDPRCGNLDKASLDKMAEKLEVEYELIPITVGFISKSDRDSFNRFASDRYIELETAEELPGLIDEILSTPLSFYNYGRKKSD